MKRIILILFLLLVLAGGIYGYDFYRKNLRGALAPLRPAPSASTNEAENNSQNSTGIPLKLPAGATISTFAKNLDGPRVITADPEGNLLTSLTGSGKVVALPDKNKDGIADSTITVAENLNNPHGIAFLCHNKCQLYIAETNSVSVFEYDQETLKAFNKKKIIDLPSGGGHFTRTLLVTPDNKLLISIGSSCNVCSEKDPRRASIWIADSDGANFHPFAKGLRNSVFMARNPKTGEIWATEMGRDLLGDDTPPDEINIIKSPSAGSGPLDYGWPNCYGKNTPDLTFNKKADCSQTEPSYVDLQAHSAPLGLSFLGSDLLVAYHGSWNRSVPTGYKIVKIDRNGKVEDFITGWFDGKNVYGRPVDIFSDNNNLYISDDKAGVIYLLTLK